MEFGALGRAQVRQVACEQALEMLAQALGQVYRDRHVIKDEAMKFHTAPATAPAALASGQ